MKKYFCFILFLFGVVTFGQEDKSNQYCESKLFRYELKELPHKKVNAYKLAIISKKSKKRKYCILDIYPSMSQIDYCNDLYVVLGFPCGGPCYSRVFVFTNGAKKNKQFGFPQQIKNNSKIIAYIKNEVFEKLIIHNLLNDKELIVDISDCNPFYYGQPDSLIFINNKLKISYTNITKKRVNKVINLKTIL